jgi:hypothetical protein
MSSIVSIRIFDEDFCAVFTGPAPTTIETADGKAYDLSPYEDFFAKP